MSSRYGTAAPKRPRAAGITGPWYHGDANRRTTFAFK
jgi:hypothetical protein